MAIKDALVAELKHESTNTKKILERVPNDNLLWKPHEKSMSLGRLATHIAELPLWIERSVNADEFDFAAAVFKPSIASNTQELLKIFEDHLSSAIQILESATDENLNSSWTAKRGEQIIYSMPKKLVIRNFTLNHIYHHRGQLSVFLRLLNISVPGLYGPSADEQ